MIAKKFVTAEEIQALFNGMPSASVNEFIEAFSQKFGVDLLVCNTNPKEVLMHEAAMTLELLNVYLAFFAPVVARLGQIMNTHTDDLVGGILAAISAKLEEEGIDLNFNSEDN